MSNQEKQPGTVKWFNNAKGYGFAINESEDDVFIHYRAIMGDQNYKTLSEGQQVSFVQVRSDKGWQAAEVELLETM